MRGRLTEYFTGTASKILSAVETGRSERHHQHEFNGVSPLKAMFGEEKQVFETTFMYFGDGEDDVKQGAGTMTWYDSRAAHPTRSEYRLYFSTDFIPDHAQPGDVMIMGLRPDGSVLVIVCAQHSNHARLFLWLFGMEQLGDRFAFRDEEATGNIAVAPAMQLVLSQLGIDTKPPVDAALLETMLQRFGGEFPSTRVFSAFARETLPESISLDDPDMALTSWIAHEERLFRTLERHIVSQRIDKGFTGENRVDDFVAYSLHVQNRRKARAGSALENHMEYLLGQRRVRFERGAVTEGRAKPDFLFPGAREYHDTDFPVERLTMLGSKTSAKDRWRQILAEAARIPVKHLLTLQPDITTHQFDEMHTHRVVPVIPQGIREGYSPNLRAESISVGEFVEYVLKRQAVKANTPIV